MGEYVSEDSAVKKQRNISQVFLLKEAVMNIQGIFFTSNIHSFPVTLEEGGNEHLFFERELVEFRACGHKRGNFRGKGMREKKCNHHSKNRKG